MTTPAGGISAHSMTPTTHHPDHFVVGISNLEAGMQLFEDASGVRPAFGGSHAHIGTHNALISLGEKTYLEIIAPDPQADMAALDPELRALFRDPLENMHELTPFLWAVGSTHLEQTAALLKLEGIRLSPLEAGARTRPDGSRLEWRAMFITHPQGPGLPFFIEWKDPASAPATDSPAGCRLKSFAVSHPRADRVRAIVSRLGIAATISQSQDPGLVIKLDCPSGGVTL